MKINITHVAEHTWHESVCCSCNESTVVANESFLSLNASDWSIDHTDLLLTWLSITTCRAVKVIGWISLDCLKLTARPCNKIRPKCPRFCSIRNRYDVCVSSIIIYHLIKGTNSPLALGHVSLWDIVGRRLKEKFLKRNLWWVLVFN